MLGEQSNGRVNSPMVGITNGERALVMTCGESGRIVHHAFGGHDVHGQQKVSLQRVCRVVSLICHVNVI